MAGRSGVIIGNINVARELSSHRSTGMVGLGPHGLPCIGDWPSKGPKLEINIFLSTTAMCANHIVQTSRCWRKDI